MSLRTCECPEGPYYGAQLLGTITKCERCGFVPLDVFQDWLIRAYSDGDLRRELERRGADRAPQCCCRWGAARGGRGHPGDAEWPEFGCYRCPVHEHGLGERPDELCRRHERDMGPG